MHIGKVIHQELKLQGRTVTWFAKQICCDRTNVYNIFHKSSIDTSLLIRISKLLNHNFFDDFKDEV